MSLNYYDRTAMRRVGDQVSTENYLEVASWCDGQVIVNFKNGQVEHVEIRIGKDVVARVGDYVTVDLYNTDPKPGDFLVSTKEVFEREYIHTDKLD